MRVQSVGEYYTLHGAAEALGVSYWQVWRAIRQRQAPTLLLGQTLLVRLADLRLALGGASDQQAPAAQEAAPPTAVAGYRARGQVCPECGSNALVYQEGCQTCLACGYARC